MGLNNCVTRTNRHLNIFVFENRQELLRHVLDVLGFLRNSVEHLAGASRSVPERPSRTTRTDEQTTSNEQPLESTSSRKRLMGPKARRSIHPTATIITIYANKNKASTWMKSSKLPLGDYWWRDAQVQSTCCNCRKPSAACLDGVAARRVTPRRESSNEFN